MARSSHESPGEKPGALIADVNWTKLGGALPSLRSAKFRGLAAKSGEREAGAGNIDLVALAAQLPPEELLELLLVQVAQAIGQILHMPAEKLNRDCSVFDLGMDSLMGLELRLSIEERFGVEISVMALSQDISVRRIAEMIRDRLTGTVPAIEAEPPAQDPLQEQAHILSRHAEDLDTDMIADAMKNLDDGAARPRLIP